MLKRAMPEDLKRKFQLQRVQPDPDWPPCAQEKFMQVEAYCIPVPLFPVNCWFAIFPHTKITNPNELIVSSETGVASITLEKMWEMEVSEFYQYLQEHIAKEMKEYEKRIQLN